ncbi:MAG TPA: hypothetical protein PK360_08930 [bacterium]|nr:hypothetical protein [bacterium]
MKNVEKSAQNRHFELFILFNLPGRNLEIVQKNRIEGKRRRNPREWLGENEGEEERARKSIHPPFHPGMIPENMENKIMSGKERKILASTIVCSEFMINKKESKENKGQRGEAPCPFLPDSCLFLGSPCW